MINKITVISSYAVDRLITKNNIIEQSGGPALFISKALDKLKINYEVFSGEKPAIVEINMINNIEKGRIISVEKINPQIKDPEFVLISTLLDEFNLKAIGKFNCLDIQGYVRDGKDFGKKKFFDSPEIEKFNIVKMTKEESRYIDKSRITAIRLLIITMGKKGFKIIKDNKEEYFGIEKIKPKDTIGAGDTFFTAFCVKYYETKDIFKSANFAREFTSNFLEEKV